MAKQRKPKQKKYTEEFRRQAVERMKETENVKAWRANWGSTDTPCMTGASGARISVISEPQMGGAAIRKRSSES